jgi:hypothetical protein
MLQVLQRGNTLYLSANLRREGILFVEENQLSPLQQQATVAPPASTQPGEAAGEKI